jgi:hypothetical protein
MADRKVRGTLGPRDPEGNLKTDYVENVLSFSVISQIIR